MTKKDKDKIEKFMETWKNAFEFYIDGQPLKRVWTKKYGWYNVFIVDLKVGDITLERMDKSPLMHTVRIKDFNKEWFLEEKKK